MAATNIWGTVGNQAFSIPLVKLTPSLPTTQSYFLAWSTSEQALDYVLPRPGWGDPTGTATRTAFATGTVTLPELAAAVKALIDDLKTLQLLSS